MKGCVGQAMHKQKQGEKNTPKKPAVKQGRCKLERRHKHKEKEANKSRYRELLHSSIIQWRENKRLKEENVTGMRPWL